MSLQSGRNLTLAVLVFCLTQPTLPQGPQVTALSRTVALNHSNLTSSAAISMLLSEAHTPGGVISIYDGCSHPSLREFFLEETTLAKGLDYVSKIDGPRKWKYLNGTVLVDSELVGRTVLGTVITDLDIYPNEPLSRTTQRLLSATEVQDSIRRAGLDELSPELGFAQITAVPAPHPPPRVAGPPKHLRNVSLVDALLAVADSHGTGVWEYQQFKCNDKTSFRLDWIVK